MKFTTAKEHRDFFQKHGWIEFESLLSSDQVASANQAIDQVLAERAQIASGRARLLSSEKMYLQGRDLWRSNAFLHKLVTQVRFAEIAAELLEKKPLRLGYDQFLPARHPTSSSAPAFGNETSSVSVYANFLEKVLPLEAVSCVYGVVGGLIFSLGGKEQVLSETEGASEEEPKGIDIFPSQPGHAIFFQPQVAVDWSRLYNHLDQRFYLIVYTQASAHYQLQPQDPHTHALKRLGYIFNDKLSDKLNPIVYR